MPKNKKYIAFISFADPDRNIAEALHNFFWELGEDTYYAPGQLPSAGSIEWKQAIIKGVKESVCFLPIYTRNSIKRAWVLYESGVADCINSKRYAARVSSVSISEIEKLPSPGVYVYDLFNDESLTNLVVNILMHKPNRTKSEIEAKVRKVFHKSKFSKQIIEYAKTRWVFIAGNIPNGHFLEDSIKQLEWLKDRNKVRTRIKSFTRKLSRALLNANFSLSSCDTVPAVGHSVHLECTKHISEHKSLKKDIFEHCGLYPLDRKSRINPFSSAQLALLRNYRNIRRGYLSDKEYLIVIGGNDGTMEEFEIAKELGLKIWAIPCFGGAGLKLWQTDPDYQGHCANCIKKDEPCDTTALINFAEKL